GGPGHQLAIQTEPVCLEGLPQTTALAGVTYSVDNLALQRQIGKESPARTRVDDAPAVIGDAKAFSRRGIIAADEYHRPGAHVLLLAYDLWHTLRAIVGERLGWMLQEAGRGAGFARRHGGRQVD